MSFTRTRPQCIAALSYPETPSRSPSVHLCFINRLMNWNTRGLIRLRSLEYFALSACWVPLWIRPSVGRRVFSTRLRLQHGEDEPYKHTVTPLQNRRCASWGFRFFVCLWRIFSRQSVQKYSVLTEGLTVMLRLYISQTSWWWCQKIVVKPRGPKNTHSVLFNVVCFGLTLDAAERRQKALSGWQYYKRRDVFVWLCRICNAFCESSSIMHNSRAIPWTETGTERQHGCVKGIIHPEMIFHTHVVPVQVLQWVTYSFPLIKLL